MFSPTTVVGVMIFYSNLLTYISYYSALTDTTKPKTISSVMLMSFTSSLFSFHYAFREAMVYLLEFRLKNRNIDGDHKR